MVSTPMKNISQLGLLFSIYGKIKNVPNHQPVLLCIIVCQNSHYYSALHGDLKHVTYSTEPCYKMTIDHDNTPIIHNALYDATILLLDYTKKLFQK